MNAFQRAMTGLRKVFGFYQMPKSKRPVQYSMSPEVEAANRAWQYYDARMSLAQTRIEVYKEMEEMDDDDIIHSALDAFAEDATQPDPFTSRTLWVESENIELQEIIHDFLDDIEYEDQIFSITRNVCKFGDDFEQVITAAGQGVIGVEWLDPKQVERLQDDDGRIVGWKVYEGEIPSTLDQPSPAMDSDQEGEEVAAPWDIVHFRLLGGQRKSVRRDFFNRGVIYGQSAVFASRRVWRRFRMMEDSMMMYRVRRAPDRDIYYIDCTGLNPGEQWDHARRWYKEFKKRQYVNQVAGDYKTEQNPLGHDEDIWLPIVEGRNTRIERQAGSTNIGDVHDMEFMVNRVFSTLRIPKEYFGFDSEGWDQNKALAQKDIRFARTCKRIQRAVVLGTTRLIQIHLALIGIDPTLEQNEFTVKMTPISLLEEQGRAELYGVRMDLIDKLISMGETLGLDNKKWAFYVVRTFGGFPESISKSMLKEIEPQAGGGGGGGLGGELGGLGGGEELGGELGGGEELGAELGGGEELGGELEVGGEELGAELESAILADPELRHLVERFRFLTERRGVSAKSRRNAKRLRSELPTVADDTPPSGAPTA